MKLNNDTRTKYPPDSAGGLMISEVPVAHWRDSIGEIKARLYRKAKDLETINYIYLVNRDKALKGVISIKDILRQPNEKAASEVMVRDPVVVHPHTDQERVAYRALKNNIKALPVVDQDKKLIGVVPSDLILGIMYKETSEDLLRLVGVGHKTSVNDNILEMPVIASLKHRLPWLLIGLLGGVIAARIIGFFEDILSANIILAAFIPLIVYISDAVGTQMEAFIIRDMALNPKFPFRRYFFRQLWVVALIAVILSGTFYFIGFGFYHNVSIAYVVAIALFTAIISSVFTGLIVPYIFSKFKQDPANASGPIATIIQDILSVLIYFLVASWLI